MRNRVLKLGETEIPYQVYSDGSITFKDGRYYINQIGSEVLVSQTAIGTDRQEEIFIVYISDIKNVRRYMTEVNHERIEGVNMYDVIAHGLLMYRGVAHEV